MKLSEDSNSEGFNGLSWIVIGDDMPKTKIKLLEGHEKELVAKGAKKKGLIITVSGFSGSGKSSVVKMLMDAFPQLKLVYSGGIFRENAEKAGMTLEKYCATREEQDDIDTDKELFRMSIAGNAIADSRIAAWTLGNWADFRIFVVGPFGARVDRVAKREGIKTSQARNMLEARDSSDSRRYRELYGIDVNDLDIYDIIIDNGGTMEELKRGVKMVAEGIGKSS